MTRRVLLADDEAGIRTVVGLQLQRRGWEVLTVSDGEAALAAARTGDYDVLVLDQRMPGLTGLEVAQALATEVPVIVYSAYLDDELHRQARELGCHTSTKTDITALLDRIEQLTAT
ncbi:response regulator [Egicoccus sp. AB-alg6-2]|uniref:response regulator n=1 Tax=Egicoccus sp. AB-alg6-2 TaxID=3242692 RepID=UPI00359DF963